ncbi:MAG TPA: FtsX-like permease family protein [Mycobacteriales bacterium]
MWLAVRYRRLQALMLLALSALITVCTVLTPLYDRAMQQALTRLTVDASSSSATAVQVTALSRFNSGVDIPGYEPASHDRLAGLLPESARPWFQPRIDSSSLTVVRVDRAGPPSVGELLWRDGACTHVTWTAGGCPRDSGDIAVSAADAATFGLRAGATIQVQERPRVEQEDQLPILELRVTGVYRQTPGAYWDDRLLEGVSGFPDPTPPHVQFHDTWLTSRASFLGPGAARWLDAVNSVAFNLDRAAVGVDEVVRTGPLVSAMTEAAVLRVDDSGQPINGADTVVAEVQSGLQGISGTIEDGRRQAHVTVPLLMIQLGLLALFVLGLVLGAAVEQRRPELALARLRGAGRGDARRLVMAEVLPVVLAGVPVGVAGALVLAAVARHTVLGGAAPFELRGAFWAAIAAAAVILAALTWLAATRGTRDPIALLLRGVPTRVPGWSLGVVDAVVIAGAGTAVLAFATGGLEGPLALAAPGLLALIVGLLLAHLIVPAAVWLGRRLMARGRYAAALSMLALARRPSTRRVFAVITVASALLTFSTYAIGVGSRNRELAARRDNGAPMVAEVTGTDVGRVLGALAPVAGSHATPVVRMAPAGQQRRTTMAVVPADFSRIALFPDADPGSVPWSDLGRAQTGRRLSITGSAISLLARSDGLRASSPEKHVQLELINAGGDPITVDLGGVPVGRPGTLTATVPCASGCTVTGFGIRSTPGSRYEGRLTISDVRVPGGSADLPGTVADWRPGAKDLSRVEATAAGPGSLTVRLLNDGVGPLGMTSRYLPTSSPALVAGPGTDPAARQVTGTGLNGADRDLDIVGRLPLAPAVSGPAALVDLDLFQRWGNRVARTSRIQVWFDSEDPAVLAPVQEALRRNGVEVSDVHRVSDVRRSYEASVPSWSLQLGGLVAVAALLFAGLVIVLVVAGAWRRRSRDLACLALSGVPRRGLGRMASGEQLPVVFLAVLAGAACGQLGAFFALPTVPLFAVAREPWTLDLSTPVGSVLAVLAIELVVLGLVAWLCGRVVLARARLTRVAETL